jgi:RNA polymerase sigma-70 factor, ECF subfamily
VHRAPDDGVSPQAAEPSDAELIARALERGDAESFELLVRRHYGPAFAVGLAVMGNRADAEDVTHDGIVQALARLEECRQPAQFAQWLAAIVRNRARNELIRPSRNRSVQIELHAPATPAVAPRDMELDELRDTLESALAQLPELQREVLLLHDLHDWPHEEIGTLIGTSAGMCRQHLFKARRRLRSLLGPDLLKEFMYE